MEMGARRSQVVWMILQDILMFTAARMAIGIPLRNGGGTLVVFISLWRRHWMT